MAKKVWVIEQGSYSDYRVVGVFSSRENAQRVADALKGDSESAEIAEWSLDPAVEELRKGYRPYLFEMRRDGTVERCVPWEVSGYELAGHVDIWRRSTAPAYRGKGIEDCLHGTVWAKDEKHAVKIANEYRTRFIAEGRWDSPQAVGAVDPQVGTTTG